MFLVQNYPFLQFIRFVLLLSVNLYRRPRIDMSSLEWFGRLNYVKYCCLDHSGVVLLTVPSFLISVATLP